MQIIPAIDIIDGKCVRLTKGDFKAKKIYDYSPLEMAKRYEDNGIQFLHVVDLDGAKTGTIQNQKTLELLASSTDLEIDFGGGLKTTADVKTALNAGARQITAGSIAAKNFELVKDWISTFGADKIILGADVLDEKIMVGGWQEKTNVDLFEFVKSYREVGINRVISTDVNVDGMLTGPSLGLYKKLIKEFESMEIIASGGVSNTADLDELKAINVTGVIIGKAIYENRISLEELKNYVD